MATRYGAAELYGFEVSALPPEKLQELARAKNRDMPCPFKPQETAQRIPRCHKKGGVCSLRQYVQEHGEVRVTGQPATTCPARFLERKLIFEWVGEILLGTKSPLVISELPFLMSPQLAEEEEGDADAVGKIDSVLVNPDGTDTLKWCALEMQAVYFSGKSMENDFAEMRSWQGPGLVFPKVQRRPDFRSSGPKRLMPQLQIKVPTISRWGKKMAVIIDKAFWESLGAIRETRDLSNAEIAWFVVSYGEPIDGRFPLQCEGVHYTTLNHAIEGLTGGTPMSLENFENEIRARMQKIASRGPFQ
jgi:hypothetical protein